MTPERIRKLLEAVKQGKVGIEEAIGRFGNLPFEDLGFAHIDHHRAIRQGFPEVIFCEGKTPDQVVKITNRIVNTGATLLGTRVDEATANFILEQFSDADYNRLGRTIVIRGQEQKMVERAGTIMVIAAGTSDIPIAEEAVVTAKVMGNTVEQLYDVGVAGIHRLLAYRERIVGASVAIVVAGMEGALPSVVGGLVDVPIIAVPTSVGYGANFGGLSALLAMLNSCASGVMVVNIDNGYGAGVAASRINQVRFGDK